MEHSIQRIPSDHQSEDRLELYALGRLADSDAEVIEEHLFICTPCRELLEECAQFAGSMRDVMRQEPLPAVERRASWFAWMFQPRFAMAGGFAAVLLATGLYWSGATRMPAMATLQLTAMRGDMQIVKQAKQFDLTLTDAPTGGGPFQVELVDGSGSKVWSAPTGGPKVEAKIARSLSPGDYFLRLYSDSGKLLHEYGFHVTE